MRATFTRNLLIGIIVIFFVSILVLLFIINKKTSTPISVTNLNSNLVNGSTAIDISKIPETLTQNYVKNVKNITYKVAPFEETPVHFPIVVTTSSGKYEYNVEFKGDQMIVIVAPDSQLASNTKVLGQITSQIIIASSMQKFDKQLVSGDLFDQTIRNDNTSYIEKVINDKNLYSVNIVNL